MSAVKPHTTSESPHKVIREPEFAKRLTQACDAHPHVPALHNGRLSWIKRELSKRFSEDVSVETVRKWFHGEAKPRPDKLGKLAQLLEVDTAWLSLGIDAQLDPRERKARNAVADGAVNVVAGLIQMDGGHPAFPEEDEGPVDLHAIIRGAKYDIHVAAGEADGKELRFAVAPVTDEVLVLGVVKTGFKIDIYEITPEVIAKGRNRGGSVEVQVKASELRAVETFRNRI